MAISGRTRIEVLVRDGQACVYCGARPTHEALHIDHVHPRHEGGPDHKDNYVTACRSCNLGKGKRGLYPSGLSLTAVMSAVHNAQHLVQWSVADLARRPWLRMIGLLSDVWQARWMFPGESVDWPAGDRRDFDQRQRAIIEDMVACCDAANGDQWAIEVHLSSFASAVGWATSMGEFAHRVRLYTQHWAHLELRRPE